MSNKLNKNEIPSSFPILREEDYHTHYLGKTEDGRQFFGYYTFFFPTGVPREEWEKYRKEYVILYIFDNEGNFLKTNHWYAGTAAETELAATNEKLEQMIEELGPIEYGDIIVKPFQTVIDGIVFGLVPNEEYGTVDLELSSTISFHEPWDGEYDT